MSETNDPRLSSFVPNADGSLFPIQNLPYGVFRPAGRERARVGVRIGDHVLDFAALHEAGLWAELEFMTEDTACAEALNPIMAAGSQAWQRLRRHLSWLLRSDTAALRDDEEVKARSLIPVDQVQMELPALIGDYTDFYSSREHATNVGTMFRGKDNALMPNWLHLPVAYHGRASSVVVSGTGIRRPLGQTRPDDDEPPVFGPSRLMDFELEMGFFVGPGNALGEPLTAKAAPEQIFGLVLVNDWSARDIQKWEYQPLGPFNAKNFATSISPWVVSLEALQPFRCAGPVQDPEPFDYLKTELNWSIDICLEVFLTGRGESEPTRICRSNFKHLYWNICQQLTHHTISGCGLRPGDLLASGTISAPDPSGYGSLLELTWRGSKPLTLASGEQRRFLQDGDTVTITGVCEGDDYRIGFGEVSGVVLPSIELE
jgi:fumarylacetoacetase